MAWAISSQQCALASACLMLTAAGAVGATENASSAPAFEFNPSGSVRAAYFSSTRELDAQKNLLGAALWLKAAPKLSKDIGVVLDAWVRNENLGDHGVTRGKLREAYVNASVGPVDFRLGKQIIAWGRADELNPTDNLSARDYRLLTPENNDQRFGVVALKAAWHIKDYTLSTFWLPRFNSNSFPIENTPGVNYSYHAPRINQAGIKFEQGGGEIDWSVSYYSGLDLNPDIRIGKLSASGIDLALENKRIRVLGVDAATVLGRYGVRGEAAYTWTEKGNDPLVKKSHFYAVVGADRTFFDHLNVNLQYYVRRVASYQNPAHITNPALRSLAMQGAGIANQLDRVQHGMSLRVANKWLNETLEGEVLVVHSFTQGDYLLKPKLIYAVNDQIKASLGVDLYRGNSLTYFGRLRNNSGAYAEVKYSF